MRDIILRTKEGNILKIFVLRENYLNSNYKSQGIFKDQQDKGLIS